MSQTPTKPSKRTLDAAQVIEFLSDNPDFLQQNPNLYQVMTPPERGLGEGVSDLQSAIIERLRGDAERLKLRQRDLMITSRANLSTQARVHECVLALLAATSFEQVIQVVTSDFAILLDLDIVTFCVEMEAGDNIVTLPTVGLRGVREGVVDSVMGEGRAVTLYSDIDGDPEIFGGGATLVRSTALVRIDVSKASPPALIAFGTRKSGKFHAKQGTELLNFLGRVLEYVTRTWLELPE
jgi:uncharacterized protein